MCTPTENNINQSILFSVSTKTNTKNFFFSLLSLSHPIQTNSIWNNLDLIKKKKKKKINRLQIFTLKNKKKKEKWGKEGRNLRNKRN